MYSQLLHCGYPDNMDSSWIQGKKELQTFDWYKLPLLQTLPNEDTTLANEDTTNLFYLPWIYVYLT